MFALLFSLLLTIAPMKTADARLTVEITNVVKNGGTVRIALYKPGATFGETPPAFAKSVKVLKAENQSVEFMVPPGRYAVALYHDLNGNDELDKNMVGIPKEPYGFSTNFRPRFSGPSFDDCAFDHKAAGTSISIKLID